MTQSSGDRPVRTIGDGSRVGCVGEMMCEPLLRQLRTRRSTGGWEFSQEELSTRTSHSLAPLSFAERPEGIRRIEDPNIPENGRLAGRLPPLGWGGKKGCAALPTAFAIEPVRRRTFLKAPSPGGGMPATDAVPRAFDDGAYDAGRLA